MPVEITLTKEVEEWAKRYDLKLRGDSRDEYAKWTIQDYTTLLDYYKQSQAMIVDCARHAYRGELDKWVSTGTKVLDWGGGAGTWAYACFLRDAWVDYYDINELCISFVKDLGFARVVSKLDKHYEVIIFRDVIEHLKDYRAVLKDLMTRTIPGGILYVKAEFAGKKVERNAEYPFHFHDPYGYREMLVEGGFEEIEECVWRKKRRSEL